MLEYPIFLLENKFWEILFGKATIGRMLLLKNKAGDKNFQPTSDR